MIDQELINEVHDLYQEGVDIPKHLTMELHKNYCLVIEDNTELHKEVVRLRDGNDHLAKSLHLANMAYCNLSAENAALINESDDGVDSVI